MNVLPAVTLTFVAAVNGPHCGPDGVTTDASDFRFPSYTSIRGPKFTAYLSPLNSGPVSVTLRFRAAELTTSYQSVSPSVLIVVLIEPDSGIARSGVSLRSIGFIPKSAAQRPPSAAYASSTPAPKYGS